MDRCSYCPTIRDAINPDRAIWYSVDRLLRSSGWLARRIKIPDFKEEFDLFPLFGIPFVLIGFGMLSSPYWTMRKARRTAYVLTTARAIIFDGGFSTTIRSFGPDRLTDLRRKQRADGSGDVIFERKLSYDSDRSAINRPWFSGHRGCQRGRRYGTPTS